MKGEGRRVNSGASNYGGLWAEHWGQDYSQLGRISIGSGQDCCRLGAGFPSARGRIPVDSGQDSRQPGARDPRRLGAGFPVSPGQDSRRLGAGSSMKGEGRRVNSGASNYGGSRNEYYSIVVAVGPSPPPPPPPRRAQATKKNCWSFLVFFWSAAVALLAVFHWQRALFYKVARERSTVYMLGGWGVASGPPPEASTGNNL